MSCCTFNLFSLFDSSATRENTLPPAVFQLLDGIFTIFRHPAGGF